MIEKEPHRVRAFGPYTAGFLCGDDMDGREKRFRTLKIRLAEKIDGWFYLN